MSEIWTSYTPGDPLPDKHARVHVICRDETRDEGWVESFDWAELGEWTIIKYRVIEPDVEWLE